MKKVLLITIIIPVSFAGCIAIDRLAAQGVPKELQQQPEGDYPLDKKYSAKGAFKVASKKFSRDQTRFRECKIWYPEGLPTNNLTYPVVVFANGSGWRYRKYEPVFEHLASWGFVTIGNDDASNWSGESTIQSLNFLREQNQDSESPLYKKLDLSRAGVSGHSQGGVGAINAASTNGSDLPFASVYTASTTQQLIAKDFKWPYDVSKVKVPYFSVAGTGFFDGGNGKDPDHGIAPLKSMQANFNAVSHNGLTVMARRREADHGAMLTLPNSYMVAWFLHTLKHDPEASQVFTGEAPEISRNQRHWQDVQIRPNP